jgi:chemotaxis protein methyltransferase CheR
MTPEEFRLLSQLICEHCGIRVREENSFLLERRLAAQLSSLGLANFTEYHRYLRFAPGRQAALEAAVEALATHETYFYREASQLESFREELLPKLARDCASSRRLRFWSAGCSTGEEAYTIAMLVLDSRLFKGWRVEVVGSDISPRVLALARKGIYRKAALRELPTELLDRYLALLGEHYAVREEVRRLVSFHRANLLDEEALGQGGRFEVIFCRNVMIYFDPLARRRLLRNLNQNLVEGGHLLLGSSESLINAAADFELVHLKRDLVYRKPVRSVT